MSRFFLGVIVLIASAILPAEVPSIARLGIDSTAQAVPPGCKQNPDGTLECKRSKPNLRQSKSSDPVRATSPSNQRKGPGTPGSAKGNLNSSRSN